MSIQDAPRISNGKKLEWADDFSVGISSLDHQHRDLLRIINKLADHKNSSIYSEAVSSIFGGLMNYVQQHFSLEEELMKKNGYPGLEAHKAQHFKFSEEMVSLMTKPGSLTTEDLLNYLLQWFESHVRHDDQDYGQYFADMSVMKH